MASTGMQTLPPSVAAVFAGYPPDIRDRMLRIRALILQTASETDGVGAIEETLKWGEPSYLTSETGSGTTLRLSWRPKAPDEISLCVHCQTTLVSEFRVQFPGTFVYDGTRRIVLGKSDDIPETPLSVCIAAALTYHSRKKSR